MNFGAPDSTHTHTLQNAHPMPPDSRLQLQRIVGSAGISMRRLQKAVIELPLGYVESHKAAGTVRMEFRSCAKGQGPKAPLHNVRGMHTHS